jgi:predicted transcriptional regulator of viral defense system
MKALEALRRLTAAASAQWGFVTAAQAAALGVSRLWLSRLTAEGLLEREAQGVYRAAGAAGDRFDALRVAFIATNPAVPAGERAQASVPDAVVSGRAAAYLHGLGQMVPEPYEFTVPSRRKTRRDEIVLKSRRLQPGDVTRREGLPVTTVERTIADLVEGWEDLSVIGGVVADAANLDPERMAERLAPFAARRGFARGNGAGLWADLERLAGRPACSTGANRLAESRSKE